MSCNLNAVVLFCFFNCVSFSALMLLVSWQAGIQSCATYPEMFSFRTSKWRKPRGVG